MDRRSKKDWRVARKSGVKGMNPVERFEQYVEYEPMSGCWLWNSAHHPQKGYGYFWHNRGNVYAHRFSYETHKGAIPDGMVICHKCDNPACVNPDHLWVGSWSDNARDMVSKGRQKKQDGEANHAAKLTEASVLKILNDDRSNVEIAQSFGIARRTVANIKSGQRWRHVYEKWQEAA